MTERNPQSNIEGIGRTLEGWVEVRRNDPRRIDEYEVIGLRNVIYEHTGARPYSMGIFFLNDIEIYRAWGYTDEEHCSYHAAFSQGILLPTVQGCPDVRIVYGEGFSATLIINANEGEIRHVVSLKPRAYHFSISGVTCASCVSRIQTLLGALPGVQNVLIVLETGVLTVESFVPQRAEVLNMALKGTKYVVSVPKPAPGLGWKKFLPLIIMFVVVMVFTVAHLPVFGYDIHTFMRFFMAGYFLVFGLLKVVNWNAFVRSYRAYDDMAQRFPLYARAYPALEIFLGLLYYAAVNTPVLHVAVALLMSQKAYSVFKQIRSGKMVQCACLGGFFAIPVTKVTLAEDFLMVAMALSMIFM